jgi:hypothetical protein
LIHTLNDGRTSAKSAEEVQHERLVPAVGFLSAQAELVVLADLRNVIPGARSVHVLRKQGALAENISVLLEAPASNEGIDISQDIIASEPDQWVSELLSLSDRVAARILVISNGTLSDGR